MCRCGGSSASACRARTACPILQLTETVRTVAADSSPTDILRGIGNWFFYGKDRLGLLDRPGRGVRQQRRAAGRDLRHPGASRWRCGAIVRWRHRAYFVLLVVVGAVVSIGAWPYDDPSPYGALFKWFAGDTAAGLALRNTPRAVPLLVLGLAGLVAAGVAALIAPLRVRGGRRCVVGVLALAALAPVLANGFLSRNLDRPESVPQYWKDAIAAMSREGELDPDPRDPRAPTSRPTAGATPSSRSRPGLTDRPYVARETLPSGSAPSVNLLVALDHRLQDGTFEPDALAAYARLANIGTVSLRSDLQYERFDTPRPRLLWQQLVDPLPKGLDAPRGFGPRTPNRAPAAGVGHRLDRAGDPGRRRQPAAGRAVRREGRDPDRPHRADRATGRSSPATGRASSTRPPPGCSTVVRWCSRPGRSTSRRCAPSCARGPTWCSPTRTGAATSSSSPASATTAGTPSVRVRTRPPTSSGWTPSRSRRATTGGPSSSSTAARSTAPTYVTPSDRPSKAVDGDPSTAWLVDGSDVVGQHITITADHPQTIDHITLAQSPVNPTDQSITKVKLTFDQGAPVTVPLDASSSTAAGQTIPIPPRTATRVEVEIAGVNRPFPKSLNPIGFTEIGFGDTRVTETVRLPVTVAKDLGRAADGHRLDVVLSRLRNDPSRRLDEELTLDRRFVLPDARSFLLSGTARIEPSAPDPVIDNAMGTTAPGTQYTSSSHLMGDADARASRAFDHDPTTAWTEEVGNPGPAWIDVSMPTAHTVDQLRLTMAADHKHSIPTQITIFADGQPVRTLPVPHVSRGARRRHRAHGRDALRPGDRQGPAHPDRRLPAAAGPDRARIGTGAHAGVDHRGRHARDPRPGGAGDHRLRVPQRSRHRGRRAVPGVGGGARRRRPQRARPRPVCAQRRPRRRLAHRADRVGRGHRLRGRPGGAVVRPGGEAGAGDPRGRADQRLRRAACGSPTRTPTRITCECAPTARRSGWCSARATTRAGRRRSTAIRSVRRYW